MNRIHAKVSGNLSAARRMAMLAALWVGISGAAQAQRAATAGLPDFTELYEKQAASVVSIETKQKVRRAGLNVPPGIDENDPFYDFFRRFGPRGQQRDRDIEVPGAGSGFIISNDGYIITNHHVVDDADEVRVQLTDKREFRAKVIGSDRRTDTALIKIEAKELQRATIGDPNKVKVGEWVVAIGQPFGLESTMTAGILSAKQRDITGTDLVPFLQSDVAINPGNSGGPLFNMAGEVVGINSQIYSRTGGFMGISFAIPIDVAMDVTGQLRSTGRVSRGWMGVQIRTVTKDVAESLGLPKSEGAEISFVEKGSPADKAGVERSDIVLRVDGKPVSGADDLSRTIAGLKPGNKVNLEVWRRGTQKQIAVTLGEIAGEKRQGRPAQKIKSDEAPSNKLGLGVTDLTPEQRKELAELNVKGGVAVADVQGAAAQAGLQAGDVILSVNNTEVKNTAEFSQAVAKADSRKAVVVLVLRGDRTVYVPIKAAG